MNNDTPRIFNEGAKISKFLNSIELKKITTVEEFLNLKKELKNNEEIIKEEVYNYNTKIRELQGERENLITLLSQLTIKSSEIDDEKLVEIAKTRAKKPETKNEEIIENTINEVKQDEINEPAIVITKTKKTKANEKNITTEEVAMTTMPKPKKTKATEKNITTEEPIKESIEPVKEITEPIKEITEPVKELIEPIKEITEPVKKSAEKTVKKIIEKKPVKNKN